MKLITLFRNFLIAAALALYTAVPAAAGEGSGSCSCPNECCFCEGTFCGESCFNVICEEGDDLVLYKSECD